MGYKVIQRYKYSLEPMLGISIASPFKLNIRNGNPMSSTLNTQLIAPNSTFTQLAYKANFSFHAGLQYKFNWKSFSLALRAGHYVRLSKGKWLNGKALVTDAPTMNALDTYLNLFVYF